MGFDQGYKSSRQRRAAAVQRIVRETRSSHFLFVFEAKAHGRRGLEVFGKFRTARISKILLLARAPRLSMSLGFFGSWRSPYIFAGAEIRYTRIVGGRASAKLSTALATISNSIVPVSGSDDFYQLDLCRIGGPEIMPRVARRPRRQLQPRIAGRIGAVTKESAIAIPSKFLHDECWRRGLEP